jgi:hypothetical protein
MLGKGIFNCVVMMDKLQKEGYDGGITPEAREIVRILPFTTRLNFTNPGVGDRYK